MKRDKLIRLQLDKQLSGIRAMLSIDRPLYGWIKTIRQALGMTAAQLAKRLGVSQVRVSHIEAFEIEDSLTISSLRDAARGLNCKLVYFLIPEKTLEESVMDQAKKAITEKSKEASHSMSLENQAISEKDVNDFIRIQAEELIFERPNKVWELR